MLFSERGENMKPLLSVIIPAYNEKEVIAQSVQTICEHLQKLAMRYEVLLVDDGSADGTWETILQLSEKSGGIIRGVRFSRNFGKESAIFAGLAQCKGDAAVVMDCDLQHPPEKIAEMVRIWNGGKISVVECVKRSRGKEPLLYRFFAKAFYRILKVVSGMDLRASSDFMLIDRVVLDTLLAMPERQPFFRALSRWTGFEKVCLEFDVSEGANRPSKWSKWGLVRYAVRNVTTFTTMPMHLVSVMGAVFFVFSVILFIQTLYMKFFRNADNGFTTVILLLLITGSILMFSIGILGVYIAKIYDEVKGRPRYIVRELTAEPTAKPQKTEETKMEQ